MAAAPGKEDTTTGERLPGTAPTRLSLRATERLWIVSRDAFADFGTVRYPATSRNAWLTYGPKQRADDLGNPCFLNAMVDCK
ncbi:MAG: hypothetical protein WBE72_00290 [Terracidiphilus sp.]